MVKKAQPLGIRNAKECKCAKLGLSLKQERRRMLDCETPTHIVTNAKTWKKGRDNGLKEADMGQRVACIDNCVFLQF